MPPDDAALRRLKLTVAMAESSVRSFNIIRDELIRLRAQGPSANFDAMLSLNASSIVNAEQSLSIARERLQAALGEDRKNSVGKPQA